VVIRVVKSFSPKSRHQHVKRNTKFVANGLIGAISPNLETPLAISNTTYNIHRVSKKPDG